MYNIKNRENQFIKVEDLSFGYKKKTVIENMDLILNAGEFASLIGPNGSGKTTLGKLITGILKSNSGNVYLDGKNINNMNLASIGKKIGYLFQNPARQIFATNVYDELVFSMRFNKVDEKTIEDKAQRTLEAFDLEDIRNSKCHTLSQGEKQRLALGTLLLNNPKYLILDEPTTGLDKSRKASLSRILEEVNQQGIGVLMISHDIEFVKKHSERIIELKDGRIFNDEKCRS